MSAIKPYLNQSYEEIKQSCQQSGKLFKDKSFPANDTSLYRFNKKKGIAWKRPHEIVENPKFIVDTIEPNDLDQGQIGDCWLISACAAVATVPEYIQKVIPIEGQTFDKPDYAGIFHFRFWRFGDWIDVVVDDFLPVNAETNSLSNCHNNKDPNEMFGPLLEKAYAKLNSCYEFIDGGDAVDALVDMTGGISEAYKTKKNTSKTGGGTLVEDDKLWDILFKSFAMKSLCGASINVGTGSQEEVRKNGLVLGHAYGVESVVEMYSSNGGPFDTLRHFDTQEPSKPNSKRLIRLRNPWGEDVSWKGNWNSTSTSWDKISDELKTSLKYKENDGQFYMSFKDFCSNFDDVQLVHVNLNAFDTVSNEQYKFKLQQFNGEWIPGKNSGGCGNGDITAYWTNPQYDFSLKLENNIDDKVSIIVSLMQTEQTRKRAETNGQYIESNEALYFSIYSITDPTSNNRRDSNKFLSNGLEEVASSGLYLYQREVCKRFDLPAGDYVIIPSLFEKDKRMKFVLRVFMESTLADLQINELNKNARLKPKITNIIPEQQEQPIIALEQPLKIQEQTITEEPIVAIEQQLPENIIDFVPVDEVIYTNEYQQEEHYDYEYDDQQEPDPLSYHSRTFELPFFDKQITSLNVSKACTLM